MKESNPPSLACLVCGGPAISGSDLLPVCPEHAQMVVDIVDDIDGPVKQIPPNIALRHAASPNMKAIFGCNSCGSEFPGSPFVHRCGSPLPEEVEMALDQADDCCLVREEHEYCDRRHGHIIRAHIAALAKEKAEMRADIANLGQQVVCQQDMIRKLQARGEAKSSSIIGRGKTREDAEADIERQLHEAADSLWAE